MRRGRGSSRRRGAVAPAAVALALCIFAGAAGAAQPAGVDTRTQAGAATTAKKPSRPTPIDINSANRTQLMTLPGIGDAEARRIIAGRPYLSKADLATKGTIPTGIYLQIKNRIIAIQMQQPRARK